MLPPETPIYVAERKLLEATIGFNFHRGVLACGRRLPGPGVQRSGRCQLTRAESDDSRLPRRSRPDQPGQHHPHGRGVRLRGRWCWAAVRRSVFAAGAAGVDGSGAAPADRRVARLGGRLAVAAAADFDARGDRDRSRRRAAGRFRAAASSWHSCSAAKGTGCRPSGWPCATAAVTIPMQLGIDSLNVAVAAAVFCTAISPLPAREGYRCTRAAYSAPASPASACAAVLRRGRAARGRFRRRTASSLRDTSRVSPTRSRSLRRGTGACRPRSARALTRSVTCSPAPSCGQRLAEHLAGDDPRLAAFEGRPARCRRRTA